MTEATIIDGKAIAAGLRQRVAEAAADLRARHLIAAGLATVLVGDDPASQIYVRNKARACAEAGIASFEYRLPADASAAAILDLLARLNADDRVDGILVQLPLPCGIDAQQVIDRARSGERRRRVSPDQCRAVVERRARPRAVHAAGLRCC